MKKRVKKEDERIVIEKIIEKIKEEYEEKLKKRKKERWEFIINYLDEVPCYKARVVQRTGNDFFGRTWRKGIIIKYRKRAEDEWIEFESNTDASYQVIFPYTNDHRKTEKTFREQLIELIGENCIDEESDIMFEYYDEEDKTYNKSWEFEFKVKHILPYIL